MSTLDQKDVKHLRLDALGAALDGIVKTFGRATADVVRMAVGEEDLPGVTRLAPNAMTVSSSVLTACGRGAWSMFAVYAKAQSARIAGHVRGALNRPQYTIDMLSSILERGREDAAHVYSQEVLAKYRPCMVSAITLAKSAARMQEVPEPLLVAAATMPAPRRRPRM